MKYLVKILALFVSVFLMGCAAHSNLVPLGKGKVEANVNVGGPFIPLSSVKIPAPYFTFGVDYGISGNMNIDAMVHATAFFYKVAGFDIGAAWFPVLNDNFVPTWGVQPRVMLFASMKDNIQSRFRIYPLISNSAAWKLGSGLIYTGFDIVIPPTKPDYDDNTPVFILSPFAGYKWKLGTSTSLLTEVKWSGANVEGNQLAAEYISLGGYGALTLMFSITRSF